MEREHANQYFTKGKQLLLAKDMEGALQSFSRAIELDPQYTEAYQYRGHILSKIGKMDEAKADHRMYKSLQTGRTEDQNQADSIQPHKIDLHKVDNLYDDLTVYDEDELDFEDEVYDYAFSDDTLESDDLLDSLVSDDSEESGIAAILEFVNGEREEVPWTYLFEPTDDELTLIHDQNSEGRIVSLSEVLCLRMARPPAGYPHNPDERCHVEVIETIDGNIYHENIYSEQKFTQALFGFSTKEDTKFKYTLLPLVNIKKRFQRRHLGQILLEKNLLSDKDLKNALDEHNELKKIKIGKVLAEQANLLQSAVESEIQKAYEETKGDYKIGEILKNAGLVSDEQIEQALSYQKKLHNRKLGHFLVDKGILQEKDLYMALAEKFRIPFADLRHQKGSKKALSLLPLELIKKLKILPLSVQGETMRVATMLPDPNPICEVILRHSPVKEVDFVLVQPSHLRNILRVLF